MNWTPEQDEQLREAYLARIPVTKIAEAHRVSRPFVYTRLNHMGLTPHLFRDADWTPEQDKELEELYLAKEPLGKLTKRFEVNHRQLRQRLYDLGLIRPRERRTTPLKPVGVYVPEDVYEQLLSKAAGVKLSKYVLNLILDDLKR